MKMRYLILNLFFISPLLFSSCSNETKEGDENKKETPAQNEGDNSNAETADNTSNSDLNATYQFNPGDTIVWKAKHNDDEDFVHIGTVEISSGSAEVVNGELAAGEIILDLTTLQKGNQRLDDHLKNDDFFNVTVFPNATFQLKSHENGTVTGALTVIGITKEISFPLTMSMNENSFSISGEFELDLLPFELPSLVKVENSPPEEKESGPSSKVNIAIELSAQP
jgi:polyisoprenoid-binding protein YceI